MRSVLVGALLLALLVGVWLLVGGPPPADRTASTEPARSPVAAHERAERSDDAARAQPRADPAARARRLREGAAAREEMHRRITAALASRPPEADVAEPAAKRAAKQDEPPADGAGKIADRTGNHAYLSRVLSQDLIPLVDECHALAREHKPDLAGMLVLDVEILGDESLGGVVNTLEPAANNELTDPGLIECVRESMFAITLPPPEHGGRDAISLSLRLEPGGGE